MTGFWPSLGSNVTVYDAAWRITSRSFGLIGDYTVVRTWSLLVILALPYSVWPPPRPDQPWLESPAGGAQTRMRWHRRRLRAF